jgi:hypothetical protein
MVPDSFPRGKLQKKDSIGNRESFITGQLAESHLEVEERVLVLVPPEDILEEGRAGGEHHLVCGNVRVLARQRHVEEVLVLAQRAQTLRNVRPVVVPSQAVVLYQGGHNGYSGHLKYRSITWNTYLPVATFFVT